MPSTATSRNRLQKQGTGDNTNTWGALLNSTVFDLVDEALDGYESIAVTGDLTLTSTNYASDQARKRFLKFTGTVAATITIPAVSKLYLIWNATSASLIISTGGATTATLLAGTRQWVVCDGAGVYTDTSASSAATSAATATTQAATATTQAATATTQAGVATSAAATATTKAGEASTHAANALTYANNAAASAASVNDATLVHLAGAETITGVKTFSNGLIINSQTLDGLTAFGVSLAEAANAAAARTLIGADLAWTELSSVTPSGASVAQTGLANYNEVLVVFNAVTVSSGTATLIANMSETNGASYVGGYGISASTTAPTTVTGSVHLLLSSKATHFVPATGSGTPPDPRTLLQGAKANAVKLDWTSGSFSGTGNITIYAR